MTPDICYLDNNASTRPDPRVVAALLPFLTTHYGNPSSLHHFGAQVLARIEEARAATARLIGARDSEIVFTSGGTESNNAALHGVLAARPSRRRIVLTAVEHHALLEPAEELERRGCAVVRIGVDAAGQLDLDALASAVTPETALVSVMLANNETGVVFPLRAVVEIARRQNVPVHTDAVNAVGKLPVDVEALGVALLSLSAHKLHGPKGVGALYVRRGAPWRPWQLGGPQEGGRRGGTLNAPGIIGLGLACELARTEGLAAMTQVRELRDDFEARIRAAFPEALLAGAAAQRTPNTSCVLFPGVEAEALVLLLSEAGICVSSGAACSSGSLEPSHVLRAMGIHPEIAQGQVRFSFSRDSRPEELERVFAVLPGAVARVAAVSAG